MRKLAGAACAAMVFGFGQMAHAAGTFECQFDQIADNMGWVPPVIAVTHSEGRSSASVSDGIILAYIGAPVDAKVATDNAKRTTYVWEIKTQDGSGQNGKLLYRMTLMKADLSARIKVIPQGYGNNFDAGGSCKPLKA